MAYFFAELLFYCICLTWRQYTDMFSANVSWQLRIVVQVSVIHLSHPLAEADRNCNRITGYPRRKAYRRRPYLKTSEWSGRRCI